MLADGAKDKVAAYIHSPYSEKPIFMLENRLPNKVDAILNDSIYKDVINGLQIYTSLSVSGTYNGDPVPPYWDTQNSLKLIDPNPQESDSDLGFHERVSKDGIIAGRPFFDPISGVRINVLSKSPERDGTIKFEVRFEERGRQCYKEHVKNQIGDAFLTTYSGPGPKKLALSKDSRSALPTYYIGKTVAFRVETYKTGLGMCPKEKIEVKMTNVVVKTRGGVSLSPIQLKKNTQNRDAIIIIEPMTGFLIGNEQYFKRVVSNVDASQYIGPYVTIPEGTPLGLYTVTFEYTNLQTGAKKESTHSFRVARHDGEFEVSL